MDEIVYCLKKKGITKELHLFKAKKTTANECVSSNDSICNKMKLKDSTEKVFNCKSEDDARRECAKIGRSVCGVCVSHLYESYI